MLDDNSKNVLMDIIIIILFILFIFLTPFAFFWSVNILFNYQIDYNIKTGLAFWLLYLVIKGMFKMEVKF